MGKGPESVLPLLVQDVQVSRSKKGFRHELEPLEPSSLPLTSHPKAAAELHRESRKRLSEDPRLADDWLLMGYEEAPPAKQKL